MGNVSLTEDYDDDDDAHLCTIDCEALVTESMELRRMLGLHLDADWDQVTTRIQGLLRQVRREVTE